MRPTTANRVGAVRAADLGLPALILALALALGSLVLTGVALAALLLAVRRALPDLLRSRRSARRAADYPYGPGKSIQAAGLLLGLLAGLAGFLLAGQTFGRLTAGEGETTPLSLASVATASALLLLWTAFMAYPSGSSSRRAFLALLIALQLLLTLAALARDPAVAFAVEVLGAIPLSLLIVAAAVKLAWDSVSDLIDHPLDRRQQAEIRALLARAGIGPEDLADLRTRRCAERLFAEITLRMTASQAMDQASRRLQSLRERLEAEIAGLDLVIRLEPAGGAPDSAPTAR